MSASIEALSISINQVLQITQSLERRFEDFERRVTAIESAYVRSEALVLRAELEQAHAEFKDELRMRMEEFTEAFLDPAAAVTRPAAPPAVQTTAPLKVAKPSDYDGSHDRYETFVHELAIYLATTPSATERQKIMVALSFMKGGSAARWVNSYLMQLTWREEQVPPRHTS
jgi:hypothetical protein